MKNSEQQFSVDEVCTLTNTPRRRLRFYIQEGVVSPPMGVKRGAYYTNEHLEQILTIKKWQRSGLSLERIRELLHDDSNAPPFKPRSKGAVEVWSHLVLDDGIELHIEPSRASLSPEAVRKLSSCIVQLYSTIKEEPQGDDNE